MSRHEGSLEASHLPLLYEPAENAVSFVGRIPNPSAQENHRTDSDSVPHNARRGVLYGHMTRANTHWRRTAGPVLAVFSGPHAYISPAWYEDQNVVPTWNYAAVHVTGQLHLIDDLDEALAVLQRLVEFYEEGRPKPWTFDPRDEWIRKLATAIVAFRIDVTSIEGKLKMSQNQPAERRQKVIDALESAGDDGARAVAASVRQTLE